MSNKQPKALVVFFSHKGQNYSNGGIIDLPVGNTAVVAGFIAKATDADLFELVTAEAYPKDYNQCVAASRRELAENARPQLAEDIDIADCDLIFLGYPNWCGTMPMPVWTFLEAHDFSGKTIMPFCTHEGSGMGVSEKDLKKLAATANIKNGLAIRGSNVQQAEPAVSDWLNKNQL